MENPNLPFSAFKSVNDYRMTTYPSYASYTYTYVSGSTNNSGDVRVLLGSKYTGSATTRLFPVEKYEVFDSVVQTFYSDLPYALYGITSQSYYPTQSLMVISITQDVFGSEVVPNTVKLVIDSTSSYDDGKGNIYVSQSGVGYNIGNIFYDQGVIVLQTTASGNQFIGASGVSLDGGGQVQVNFTSSVYLIEHLISAKIEPNEYTLSAYNPQALKVPFTGSSVPVIESMMSQSIKPYITTIGLYNDENDLVAVAKLSNPIKRTFDTTQTFVIKFDT